MERKGNPKYSLRWKLFIVFIIQVLAFIVLMIGTIFVTYPDHSKSEFKAEEDVFLSMYDAHPYLVLIKMGKLGFNTCAGTLINERFVLTAAHCLFKWRKVYIYAYHKNMTILIQSIKRTSHEKFNATNPLEYDIGLIHIPSMLNYINKIYPALLPENNSKTPSGSAIVTEWQYSNYNCTKILPKGIYTLRIDIGAAQESIIYSKVKKNSNFTDCVGNFGSPLIQKQNDKIIIIGIMTGHPYPCANSNQPSVFTRVSYFSNWIHEKIKLMNKSKEITSKTSLKL